jgi:hypothetical protein
MLEEIISIFPKFVVVVVVLCLVGIMENVGFIGN